MYTRSPPPLISILNQINPTYIIHFYFFNTHYLLKFSSDCEKVNCPCPCYEHIWARSGNKFHSFLTSVLAGGERSTSHASCFTTRKIPSNFWIGGWVSFRIALDILENKNVSCSYWESHPGFFGPQHSNYTNCAIQAPHISDIWIYP
jgi:hypothetical protein